MKKVSVAALFVVSTSLATGCVSTSPTVVSDAEGEPFVDAIAMTCHEPYELGRDCGPVVGPAAELEIDGVPMKVAGSEDGTLIVLYAGSVFDQRGEGANDAYRLVQDLLTEHHIELTRVVPLVSANILKGYAIATDVPAYQVFEPYRQ